jgi:peptidyl-prolyl cis-trans isomerase SurA
MRARYHLAIVLLLAGICPAQVVDRMVAVVNKQVILESELDQAARVEFLLQGKPADKMTPDDRAAVLERLIDRSLLDQQIMNPSMFDPSGEELAEKIKEVRSEVSAATDERWLALLGSYGLTRRDMEDQLTSEFRILRFVDLRFRGLVRIQKEAISTYYRETLLPEVRKRNAPEPKLADVSEKIEQILVEQNIDSLLNDWLKTLHAQAHIEKMLTATTASGVVP